jgi:hypothetical protein
LTASLMRFVVRVRYSFSKVPMERNIRIVSGLGEYK